MEILYFIYILRIYITTVIIYNHLLMRRLERILFITMIVRYYIVYTCGLVIIFSVVINIILSVIRIKTRFFF
jgi:hypothetical protein